MPDRLAHRELRNRSSQVLREVAAGASYEVTNHGDVVALLLPPDSPIGLRIRRPRVRGGFGDLATYSRAESTATALDDLRGER